MRAIPERQEEFSSPPAESSSPTSASSGGLPAAVEATIWRGCELGTPVASVVGSGFAELDRELPGGGWPCHSVTELLCVQSAVLEWRLIGPALRTVVAQGKPIVMVGPPRLPHLPGLRHEGVDENHLVWVQADTPAERLWCTEQLVKANACGALVSWLPQARPEQVRRLQVCAQACDAPVFLFRPAAAQHEASAAPLRVLATFDVDWALQLHVFKRRGPAHTGAIRLKSVPGGLVSVLTPRLHQPSLLISSREVAAHVVGRTATPLQPRRLTAIH